MIGWALIDPEGIVTRAGSGRRLPPGAVELPQGVSPMASMVMMWRDSQLEPRPTLAVPEVSAYAGNGRAVRFAGLPQGTVADVIDSHIGGLMASLPEDKGVIDIELIDPGLYRIEVKPPRPHMPLLIDIEVLE